MTSLFDDPVEQPTVTRATMQRDFAAMLKSKRLAALPRPDNFQPAPPPELNGEKRIILNAETTGLKWWVDDRPVGWSYWLPESGRHGYLPMRHKGGGNLDPEVVHRFLASLKGVHVDNINTKFDLHMSRVDGVDLMEVAGSFGDVAHQAALLDDNRMRFNLDQLSLDILGWDVESEEGRIEDGLGKMPAGIDNEGDFKELHSSVVAPYAIRNVEQVYRLLEALSPRIIEEDLTGVLTLEQEVLKVVVEMEKNGTYLDMELLAQWREESKRRMDQIRHKVYKQTGVELDSFDSPKAMRKLFEKLHVPLTLTEPDDRGKGGGNPSFTDAVMKEAAKLHPVLNDVREGGQLSDLNSKYLDKYYEAARHSDGWLRFNLHQLRNTKDGEDQVKGAVSGRFSAAGDGNKIKPNRDGSGGYNPQQVVAVEKQLERGWCPDFVVRKLIKPGPGEACCIASDMMQVEYRLFAHYARLEGAYFMEPLQKEIGGKLVWIQGPLADFHAIVSEILLPINPKLNRKLVKNINFANIYGAGLIKFALMIGEISERTWKELTKQLRSGDRSVFRDPRLASSDEVKKVYNRMFPAVQPLLREAARVAEERGYVMTIEKRRARLAGRFHSALNRVIQGGAADINKRVITEVYKVRKQLGLTMRLTVHDELFGGLQDAAMAVHVDAILNRQYYDLRVPILWETKTGENWAACK